MDKEDFNVHMVLCWTIRNAIFGGTPAQVYFLVDQGCIKPLIELFITSDAKLIFHNG
jgi:importin subunit alpha-6/7